MHDEARFISLRRTGCYGTCPSYRVTLFADGRVSWVGHDHVGTVGRASARVDARAVRELIAMLGRIDVAQLPDEHASVCGTDAPRAFVTANEGRRTLRAYDDQSCEGPAFAELRRLEAAIDARAGAERWIEPSCPIRRDAVYFPKDSADVLAGDEPMDGVRRSVLRTAAARLKADPALGLRLRNFQDTPLTRPRLDNYVVAFADQGIARSRIVTWVLEGDDAIDPAGWGRGSVIVETGARDCLAIAR